MDRRPAHIVERQFRPTRRLSQSNGRKNRMTTPRFTITRVFDASRERVWAAWTHPDRLAGWFGPKETTGIVLEYDLRPGGVWRGRMDAPDGSSMFSKFVFERIDPPSMLVWIHGFADAEGSRAAWRGEAIRVAADTPMIVLNAPLIGQRLGYADLSGLDLLELYAFLKPATFLAPT